jgi:hypothetical protein
MGHRMLRTAGLTLAVSACCLAGVAACSDRVDGPAPVDDRVAGVMITPPSANLNVGERLTLVATVIAGAGQENRSVVWSTSNAPVATVNAVTGEVTAIAGGTTSIIAASVADPAVKGAASITVGSVGFTLVISAIKHDGVDVNLNNIVGQIDVFVLVDLSPQKIAKVDLQLNCGGADTVVAAQSIAATASGTQSITLSFNTAGFKNGPCALKTRATTATGTIVASSATPITLNNPSASATLLGAEYLRDPRFQGVELLSQSLIALDRVMPHALIDASGHAGEIRDLRL